MREYSRFQCEPRGFPQLNYIVMHNMDNTKSKNNKYSGQCEEYS